MIRQNVTVSSLNSEEIEYINHLFVKAGAATLTKEAAIQSIAFDESIAADEDVREFYLGLFVIVSAMQKAEWEALIKRLPLPVQHKGAEHEPDEQDFAE